jgi:hypothetical protein
MIQKNDINITYATEYHVPIVVDSSQRQEIIAGNAFINTRNIMRLAENSLKNGRKKSAMPKKVKKASIGSRREPVILQNIDGFIKLMSTQKNVPNVGFLDIRIKGISGLSNGLISQGDIEGKLQIISLFVPNVMRSLIRG